MVANVMLIERAESCLCRSARRQVAGLDGSGSPAVGLPAPPRQAGAEHRVRSDEEGGVRQPWEPRRTFQRTS